jgi:hypothetical protein
MIDATGVARPVGKAAIARLSAQEGKSLTVLRAPPHVVLMQDVEGPGILLAGEVSTASRLHDVCAMVAHARWRGQLVVATEEAVRRLFINDGYVIGASSTAPLERLGEVLVHFGAMDEGQVDRTIQALGDGIRFGDAAVELGFVSRETLYRYLVKQTEQIVYGAVSVHRGVFLFFDDYDDSRVTFPLSLPITELLMEGVRRMDEMEFFRSRIPGTDHVIERAQDDPPADDHPARPVWDAVDGVRNVEELARAAGLELFDVMRALYELEKRGRVVVREPRGGGVEGVVAIFNEALGLIMSEVDKYPGASEDIRASLASFAASGEVYDPLFRGAGPSADGTVDPTQVAANVAAQTGLSDPERTLAEWLYEYASFTMFIAEPVLRAGGRSDAAGVSSRVSALLAPLAPQL